MLGPRNKDDADSVNTTYGSKEHPVPSLAACIAQDYGRSENHNGASTSSNGHGDWFKSTNKNSDRPSDDYRGKSEQFLEQNSVRGAGLLVHIRD